MLLLVFLPVLLHWESVTTSLRAIRRDLRGIVLTGTLLVASQPGPSRPSRTRSACRGTPAEQLIERLTRDDLEGEEFTDRYTQAVEQLIDAKRENHQTAHG
ncbi:hypothetical protein [Streptomyces sp. NPDC005141]